MGIGENIKKRREEIGMTQMELANRLGYKDKSSISKIEKGSSDIYQSDVVRFAKVLRTTPAHLMGWDSEGKFYTDVETERLAQEMFDDPDLRALHHMKRNMDPEAFKAHMDMMKRMYLLEHPEEKDDYF